jgi:hypothetical protein
MHEIENKNFSTKGAIKTWRSLSFGVGAEKSERQQINQEPSDQFVCARFGIIFTDH